MIKLVAIDLDGTLLNDKKEISTRNQAALKKAKALGVKVVITTGRPLRGIRPFLKTLELEETGDYSITFNGGLVQKNDTGQVMDKAALSFTEVKELIELARFLDLPLDILSDDIVLQVTTSKEHRSIYDQLNPLLIFESVAESELVAERLYNKAVVAYPEGFLDQQIALIPETVQDRFEVIKSRKNLLEFMPKGIDKAYGISLLIKQLGIKPDEVMAFGDEENDLPMIEFAGVGVAMGNAIAAVKAAADLITVTNEKDGVAKVIEDLILN